MGGAAGRRRQHTDRLFPPGGRCGTWADSTGGTTGNWETDPRTDGSLIYDGGESQSAGDGLIKKSH